MTRWAWLALALVAIAGGAGLLLDTSPGSVRPSSHDVGVGSPRLVGAPAPEPEVRVAAPARRPATSSPDEGGGEAGGSSLPALPSSEIERLIASVGERGVHALADDATTREVYQRLQVAGPAALARLTEVLRSTQPTLRLGAAALLGLHGGVETARALAEQLEREATPEVRSALLQALAGIESPDGADALLRVWEAPDASEGDRRVALQGLASLGHPAARALLADPRSSAVHRRLAEIGLVRAYRVRGTSDASLRGVLETIAASSSSEASRREAAEALAETAR